MQTDPKSPKTQADQSQQTDPPSQDTEFVAQVEEDLAPLIPGFLLNRKNDIIEIQACLTAGDFKKIQRIGHTLKGVCGSYGFELLGTYGSKIEQAATQSDKDSILDYLKKMTNYLNNVKVIYIQ